MSLQQPEMIRLELPASYKYLNLLSACIAEILARVDDLPDPHALVYNIQLAAHETCTNIVDHAYDGKHGRIEINITLIEGPRRLIIEMHDNGGSFDFSTINDPDLSEPRESGYGLYLIRNLMDEVTYTTLATGNRWCLVKYL